MDEYLTDEEFAIKERMVDILDKMGYVVMKKDDYKIERDSWNSRTGDSVPMKDVYQLQTHFTAYPEDYKTATTSKEYMNYIKETLYHDLTRQVLDNNLLDIEEGRAYDYRRQYVGTMTLVLPSAMHKYYGGTVNTKIQPTTRMSIDDWLGEKETFYGKEV